MKKFNFKTLLICLLVLVLALSLVACNGGGKDKDKNKKPDQSNEDDGPKQLGNIKAEEFFTTLWNNASAIGSDKIAATDGIKLSVDLGIEVGTKSMTSLSETPDDQLTIGAALDFVLDRHNTAIEGEAADATNNSAVKVALSYGDQNLISLYLFLKDANYLYIDFDNVHIKVDAKVNNVNEQIDDLIKKYVFNAKITQPATVKDKEGKDTPNMFYSLNQKTVNDIINMFTGKMGSTWTLNTLIGDVTSLFNMNLKNLITGNSMINGLLPSLLGVDSADVFFDDDGNLKVADVLGNETLGEFFECNKNAITGGNHYSLRIAGGLFDLVSSFLSGNATVGSIIGTNGLINANSKIGFDYDIINNQIANFAIVANLKNLSVGGAMYPYAVVHINHFNFRKATAESENLGINTTDYKDDVTVELTEKLTIDGITVNAAELDKNINVNAEVQDITVGLKATVNINDNTKTKANLWIAYGTDNILEASYVGTNLAIKFNKDVKFADSEVSVLELIVKYAGSAAVNGLANNATLAWAKDGITTVAKELFGENYNEVKKDGALWTNLDVQKVLKKFVFDKYIKSDFNLDTWIQGMFAKAGQGTSEDATASAVMINGFNLTDFLNSLFSIGSFKGSDLEVHSTDVMADVAKLGALFDAANKKDWTKPKLIANLKQMIKDAFKDDENGFKTWIVKIAKAVKIDTGTNSFTGTDAEAALNYLVDTVFNTLQADVVLNFTDGMKMSVTAKFGGATIKLEHSLQAYTTATDTFKDYTPAEGSREGWYVYHITNGWYGEE